MEHQDFSIGLEFTMSGKRYRCTDVGTRVVIAICLNKENASWYKGPTYAIPELVIDEDDFAICEIEG